MRQGSFFSRFAKWMSSLLGRPLAFLTAVVVVLIWAVTGPLFHFSNTWQLVINTGTTIVTFLMVFLIQNTQNRESEAMQLKLDELIRAVKGAQDSTLDMEDLTERELRQIKNHYVHMAENARQETDAALDLSRKGDFKAENNHADSAR